MKTQIVRTRGSVGAALLGLFAVMAGCNVGSGDDASMSFKEETVTEANNASRVTLATDRVLALKLDGRPSVGSAWKIDHIDTNILQLADTELNPEQALGGTDKQVMRFKGVGKGTTVLKLSYGRPWEKVPEKTYSVEVDVAGEYTGDFHPVQVSALVGSDQGQSVVGLPQRYSLCEQGGCTPVKDQGGCGSCWAFATAGVVESVIAMRDKVSRDVSEQYLVSCNTDNMSCSGGYTAFDYFIGKVPPGQLDAGVVYESEFPYTATDQPCNGPHPHHEKLTSWKYLEDHSVGAIKQAIYEHGAIWATVCVDGEWASYRSGVFPGSNCAGANHAVVLVGWDDNGGDGYWILRNSWGTGWGENGYMRIRWGANVINDAPYYVTYGGGGDSGGGDGGGGDGGGGQCTDSNENCAYWASIGECQKNPGYMLTSCCASCESSGGGQCTDSNENCAYWASIGECEKNPGYMLTNCCASCDAQ